MLDEVTARLTAAIPDLGGRIQGAAEFAALAQGGMPTTTPVAFLLPLGLVGGNADAMTGAFVQDFAETLGVVLVFSSTDRTGAAALKKLRTIVFATIGALAGWGPTGAETGVFRVSRGSMISVRPGSIAYQLDFSIMDQVRILS